MSEEFKLNFEHQANGLLRADFRDCEDEACAIREDLMEGRDRVLFLGVRHEVPVKMSRPMAAELARALMRFALSGTLMERTPPEPVTIEIGGRLSEQEGYDLLSERVAKSALEFVTRKTALSQAYKDGYRITSHICQDLRAEMNKSEDALDGAVMALEAWMKEHGWKESEVSK